MGLGETGALLFRPTSAVSQAGCILPCTRLLRGSGPAWGPGGRKEALVTLHPPDSRLLLGWAFVRDGWGLVEGCWGNQAGRLGVTKVPCYFVDCNFPPRYPPRGTGH